ncbi:polysaccharide deacetylase family protein [Allonocardiopsis opalescens]|uniref:Peptidoglycan/xylan/chitin deacetylase (PgdA/CDA1 family) n=1 Tax=Allonocardiopsis opalescens TaxID=1144618 RepID=A0A2T0QCI1_9ACTN|nr:polysaccharide deacetylase family protein [Allonocardiopsis opalescens]PRY01615.1 peptidoglycan/xylan/chitin deacetylase (PgdA/CDA1 family) [Allonocardiopsis opalescens]
MPVYDRARARLALPIALAAVLAAAAGCSGADDRAAGNDASGRIAVEPDWIEGLEFREETLESGQVTATARHPVVPGANPFTIDVHSTIAEQQSAFVAEFAGGDAPAVLRSDTALLAASGTVLGARIVTDRSAAVPGEEPGSGPAGRSATTRWYDASTGEALPWTALLTGRNAADRLGVLVAAELLERGDVNRERVLETWPDAAVAEGTASPVPTAGATARPAERPTGGMFDNVPEDITPPTPPAPPASPGTVLAPEEARVLAEELAASPLDDIGFDGAGGIVVGFGPGEFTAADAGEVRVTVERAGTDPLLSEFGRRVRDQAVAGTRRLELGAAADDPVPSSTVDCLRVPCAALTFDDGPGEGTPAVLDALAERQARGTFFVMGQLAPEYPELLRRMVAEGHQIGNHTWKHDDLSTMSAEAVREDIERTADAIEAAAGVRPTMVRPPYGAYTQETLEALGAPAILWSNDTMDWHSRDTRRTVTVATEETRPGGIVLMHDIHPETVAGVPDIIDGLLARGFRLVTVGELYGENPPGPGEASGCLDGCVSPTGY